MISAEIDSQQSDPISSSKDWLSDVVVVLVQPMSPQYDELLLDIEAPVAVSLLACCVPLVQLAR